MTLCEKASDAGLSDGLADLSHVFFCHTQFNCLEDLGPTDGLCVSGQHKPT
jgi:hypothetical protein